MFTLPSLKIVLVAVFALCLVIGLSGYVAVPAKGLLWIPLLGFSIFALTVSADGLVTRLILRKDPVFNFRRTLVLSLFGLAFWLVFMVLGAALAHGFGEWLWVNFSLLGFAAIVTLRVIVFKATSDAAVWRKGLAVLLQPLFCLIPLAFLWAGISVLARCTYCLSS